MRDEKKVRGGDEQVGVFKHMMKQLGYQCVYVCVNDWLQEMSGRDQCDRAIM